MSSQAPTTPWNSTVQKGCPRGFLVDAEPPSDRFSRESQLVDDVCIGRPDRYRRAIQEASMEERRMIVRAALVLLAAITLGAWATTTEECTVRVEMKELVLVSAADMD